LLLNATDDVSACESIGARGEWRKEPGMTLDRRIRRLGLFGGSFNPVHWGHLLVAQAAAEEFNLDSVVFVPAAESPFKPGVALVAGEARLRWLRLALAGKPWAAVDDRELRRGGVSYTVETVREYAREFPETELYLLIGADHVESLPRWRASAELAKLAKVLAVPRPGRAQEAIPEPFQGAWLRGFRLELSASQVRERVSKGLAIDWLTGSAVAEDIRKNGLYL
jgi:nicotinate-nucleotide adenylyltransferase